MLKKDLSYFLTGFPLYRVFMEIMLLNETTYINRVDKQYVNVYFLFKALNKILVICKKPWYFDGERGATFGMKHESNNKQKQ